MIEHIEELGTEFDVAGFTLRHGGFLDDREVHVRLSRTNKNVPAGGSEFVSGFGKTGRIEIPGQPVAHISGKRDAAERCAGREVRARAGHSVERGARIIGNRIWISRL